MVSPWLLQRDPSLYPEPSRFRLHRPEGPPGSYLPYGLGSRACPARALLTATLGGVLQGLLQMHALELVPD
jgi:cytochrome P450